MMTKKKVTRLHPELELDLRSEGYKREECASYIRYRKSHGDSVFLYRTATNISATKRKVGSRLVRKHYGKPNGKLTSLKNLNAWTGLGA